jgi:DNA polymerase-3 subunit delta
VKLAPGRIGAFLQKPDEGVRAALIYGPDSGLVRERAEQLAKKIAVDPADPFRVVMLPGSAVADDPARLMDEMAAQSLSGGRRLVRIQQAAESAAPALAALLADPPPGDSFLLIEAGELEKRSKLRALCEDASAACAIACYAEEGAARERTIADILTAAGTRASREVLGFISETLPADRIAMRSELEKLALYVGPGKAVTMDDAAAALQDAGAAEIDDLVHAVGAGEAARASRLLERLYAEQTSPVAILRAAERHFMRLALARGEMDKGASAGDALKKLQPPVFWKHTEIMGAQLRRWNSPKIETALSRLYEAEAAVKRTGSPDQALCAQLLIQMAA